MKNDWIEDTLGRMSLEEKAGQIILVGFYNLTDQNEAALREKILAYRLGGLFHFARPYGALAEFIASVQRGARIPLLVASDYESGPGTNALGGISFPRAMARGWAGTEAEEYEIGRITAVQGRAVGANFTFSPVVDVNTDPQCPDVNIRAYGDLPERVTELARGYIRGLQEHGMLATVKHFPGNGGTRMDQHISPAIVDFPIDVLRSVCLRPYADLFRETDVAAVMTAHLEVPALVRELHPVSGRPVPASLSKEVVTGLLREEMGFKGVIITDASNMGGINNLYTREEAAVKAVLAGNDILLNFYPADFEREHEAVLRAVERGEIPEARLDDAVRRILAAKARIGLPETAGLPAEPAERDRIFLENECPQFAAGIAERAVTLLHNRQNILPLGDLRGRKVTVFNIHNPEIKNRSTQERLAMQDILSDRLAQRGAAVTTLEVTSDWSQRELGTHFHEAADSDVVFVNFFITPSYAIGTLTPNLNGLRLFFLGILTEMKKVVITLFGDPYVMMNFPGAPTVVCTFDETVYSQEAAVRVWFGELEPAGRMPASLKGVFERGDGTGFGLKAPPAS